MVEANQTQVQSEEQTNCPFCNKSLKRKSRYYRNGKYYCNKKCWKKQVDKQTGEKSGG